MPFSPSIVSLIIAGAFAVTVAGCGEEGSSSSAATTPAATTDAAQPATTATTTATKADVPEFSGTLIDGGTFNQSMVEANTVVHVFASWCPTCQAEAPDFAAFQRAHPDLNYLYVAVEDDPADTKAFMKEFGFAPGEVINDQDRSVEEAFGLTGQPNTVFVPEDGDLIKIIGPADTERLSQAAAQL